MTATLDAAAGENPMRWTVLAVASVLAFGSVVFAGDAPTRAARPPTADEVAAKFLSTDRAARAAAETVISGATPEFLRSVLAAARRVVQTEPPPLRVELANTGDSPEPPALPPPAAVTSKRGITIRIRLLDAPRDVMNVAGSSLGFGTPWDGESVATTDPEVTGALLRALGKGGSDITIVSAPRITVYDGQRATTEILNKIAYIDDFEVKEGVASPIVRHAMDGLVLDVRPTLAADGSSMRLDLSTKVRRVSTPIEVQEICLPGVERPVKVQRPETRTDEWTKSLGIQDGGSVVLGGWKSHDPNRRDRVTLILLDAKAIDLTEPQVEVEPTPCAPVAPQPTKPPR